MKLKNLTKNEAKRAINYGLTVRCNNGFRYWREGKKIFGSDQFGPPLELGSIKCDECTHYEILAKDEFEAIWAKVLFNFKDNKWGSVSKRDFARAVYQEMVDERDACLETKKELEEALDTIVSTEDFNENRPGSRASAQITYNTGYLRHVAREALAKVRGMKNE